MSFPTFVVLTFVGVPNISLIAGERWDTKEKFLLWQGAKRRELFLSCCGFDSYCTSLSWERNCSWLLGQCMTEQTGGDVGWANVWKAQGGAVPSITNIYSLLHTVPKFISIPAYKPSLSQSLQIQRYLYTIHYTVWVLC